MRALSLFSGIGGIDLASEWAGIETVAFCEREPFCQKVLKKHWPHVPIYDDVCTLTKERLIEDGIIGTGGQLTLFTEDTLASLLVLPGSEKAREMTATSGRRLSAYYKRSDPIGLLVKTLLDTSHWASMMCFLTWETSGTPRNRLLFQLSPSEPYTAETGYSLLPTPTKKRWEQRAKEQIPGIEDISFKLQGGYTPIGKRWDASKPRVYRVGHGIPNLVDRVGSLGNAVVPQQIYPILAAIKQIDDALKSA